VEAEHSHLRHDIDQLKEDIAGELLIAASTIPGERLLPKALAEFKSLHHDVSAQVVISDSITVIGGVRDGSYEVGLCGLPPEGKDLDYLKVADDEIVLIAFPSHRFAGRDSVAVKELAEEPFIFREETSGTQRNVAKMLGSAGLNVKALIPGMVLGTTEAVVSAVEAGLGIAFVSSLAVKRSLALGLVKQVPVSGLKLGRDFYCIYRKDRGPSRLLDEFIAFISKGIAR